MSIREFYLTVFLGVEYPDLDRMIARAELAAEAVISRPPETEEETKYYNLAVCAQVEQMGISGGAEAYAAACVSCSSFSIGSFSMSGSGGASASAHETASGLCSRAMGYLDRAGLTNRRCEVC